jgi:hypothetical protein
MKEHGLFPSSSVEFEDLLRRTPSRPPFVPSLDPKEEADVDAFVKKTLEEKFAKLNFEQKRVELGQELVSIFYDDVVAETNKDYASPSMRESYKVLFSAFQTWCAEQEHPSLPSCPEVVVLYLLVKAGERTPLSQLSRIINAVRHYHRWAEKPFDAEDVLIRAAMRWIKRRYDEQKELDRENKSPELARGTKLRSKPCARCRKRTRRPRQPKKTPR